MGDTLAETAAWPPPSSTFTFSEVTATIMASIVPYRNCVFGSSFGRLYVCRTWRRTDFISSGPLVFSGSSIQNKVGITNLKRANSLLTWARNRLDELEEHFLEESEEVLEIAVLDVQC